MDTHTKKEEKMNTGEGVRQRGGPCDGGNSFANQALVLRSISSCLWVPGVNKVISFNPALQLYIAPSDGKYPGLSIGAEGETAIWLLLAASSVCTQTLKVKL